MRKGQQWSLEIIIALTFFTILFVLMVTLLALRPESNLTSVQQQAGVVLSQFFSTGTEQKEYAFIENNVVNTQKLEDLSQIDYNSLKDSLGITDDFCIIIEDENGNVIPINGSFGVGSSNILINGSVCNASIS